MGQQADYHFMARAISLAKKGRYTTAPNPRVGCVIVKNNEIIGEGWHQVAGGPHAEIRALDAVLSTDDVCGSDVYVTLEPCAHHGRTGPCADALIKAGVARVVIAQLDPNPLVAGRGHARLLSAGICCEAGLMSEQAAALNPGFIQRMKNKRPFVRCKLAMTLDGRTAAACGESQWITGVAARADVQRLRAQSDAIMTGIGTVLADDPAMNVRVDTINSFDDQVVRDNFSQPLRVIADSHFRTPTSSQWLKIPGRKLIVGIDDSTYLDESVGDAETQITRLKELKGRVDLGLLMKHLAELEVNEVLLEAGASLCGAMLEAGFVDELVIYMAPRLLGDRGRGLLNLPGLEHLEQMIDLDISDIRRVGDDWRITAQITHH